ncbi:unnamed protein product [Ceutorhynchus assimilis]|uniref:Chitinase n=1 Tax=Ceutorhynchus assimilis TaxID=467358 RepID=A0A9N9N116_9CUCU|nr:unnamed protein product [Ceutorhynchus assimilis]
MIIDNMKTFFFGVVLTCFTVIGASKDCKQLSTSKLICYYSTVEDVIEGCYCTHIILPANSDVKAVEKLKERYKGAKVYVSVNEFNQGLIDLLKTHKIDGLEIALKKLDTKNDISDFISTIKTKIGNDLDVVLSVPAKADLVAKYFDFKSLSKHVDLYVLQTAFLGASSNVTFHPSRLSGMWDVQNTDSVVDLVSGLGAPLSKLVIAAPVQAFQFTLQNEEYTAPGSPALELQTLTRNELCKLIQSNRNWTLERDEDQAGPYIFSKNHWIAFEDSKSIDIKVKYSKIRGLAGVALKDLTQDGAQCGSSILEATYNGLSRQARAPRGAVLHSLEREMVDGSAKQLDSIQLSPYKISRIIDTEGKIHVVRQDTRTEFQCSRQGYFVHPRSCNRFYRCVKFNQLSDDYNVFEFDCPSGLAFDERVEVCVWPGSLPHGTPCSGSSEIAPVPKQRFSCPSEPGYYADPENCRWFFACLDHGKSALAAYEFRCPYGLVFDGDRLVCEWPWLVPRCSNGLGVGLDSSYYYGNDAVKGPQSAGVILQNYNGLGQLGAVKLGGLSGKIEKPIATVYSNVVGQGSGAGYLQLPLKTSQALENAGLLRVNNGAGYGGSVLANINQYDQQGAHELNKASVLIGQNQGSNINGVGKQATASILVNSGQHDQSANYQESNSHLIKGAVSSQSFNNQASNIEGHQQNSYVKNNEAISNQHFNQFQVDAELAKQINIIGGGYSIVGTPSNLHIPINENGLPLSKSPTNQVVPIPGKSVSSFDTVQSGVIANIPEYQYKINSLEDAGLVANISSNFPNFVVQSAANEATIRDQLSRGLTAALNPITVVSQDVYSIQQQPGTVFKQPQNNAAIISKFSIRKPTKTVVEDYTYQKPLYQQPQLLSTYTYQPPVQKQPLTQYTYQSVAQNSAIRPMHAYSYQPTGGSYQYANIQNKQQQFNGNSVKATYQYSTPRPETVSVVYSTPKPVQPAVVTSYYNTGSIKANSDVVEQQNIGYSYPTPQVPVVYSTPKPAQPAVISSYYNLGFTKANSDSSVVDQQNIDIGYTYPRPEVKFEEAPVVYSTPKPVQPAVITSYYNTGSVKANSDVIEQQNTGYTYPRPEVKFEESPVVYSTPKPVQPAVVTSYYNTGSIKANTNTFVEQQNIGYSYPRPEVKFEEASVVYSTPKPIQPAVISGYHNTGSIKANTDTVVEQQNIEYTYPRPEVKFEEAAVVYSTPKPVQPAVVTSYYNIGSTKANSDNSVVNQQNIDIGYTYPRPEVKFEEAPVVYSTPKPVQPAVVSSYYNTESIKANKDTIVEQQNIGYSYPRPEVKFEEAPVVYSTPKPIQPAVVSSYYNLGSTNANSDVAVKQKNIGYSYPKPEVKFEEAPVVYSTSKPVQPSVVTSYYNTGSIKANTNTVVEQQNIGYSYPKPEVKFEEAPLVYSAPKPVQPAVVTSYYNIGSNKANSDTSVVEQQNIGIGYNYPKPEVKFEEAPVVYSTPKPVQPAIVTSYYNIGSTKTDSGTVLEQQNIEYTYPRPEVKFNEAPVVYSTQKPVTQYYNHPSSTPQPQAAVVTNQFDIESTKTDLEQHIGYNYPQQEVKFDYSTPKPAQPAVVSSYYNLGSSKTSSDVVVEQKNIGYSYPRPAVKFEEAPVVYSTPKPVQPAVVASYYNLGSTKTDSNTVLKQQNIGYTYSRPEVKFNEAPVTTSTPVTHYYNLPASTPQPQAAVVTNQFNIESTKADLEQHIGFTYPQSEVKFDYSTTLKPVTEYYHEPSSTPQPAVVNSYFNIGSTKTGYSYPQQEIEIKPRPSIVAESNKGYNYPKPTLKFEEERLPVQEVPFVKKTAYVTGQENYNQAKVVVENYEFPEYEKVFGERTQQSTPKPTFTSTIKTIIARKKVQPVVTTYDSRLTSTPTVTTRPILKSTTVEPVRTYLPVTSTVATTSALPKRTKTKVVEQYVASRDYLPSRNYLPTREYLPATTEEPEITTLSREYLPIRTRLRITTTGSPGNKIPSRPVTVIKQNDAHPLLSAKLGAQCTCVSNTLKLRKKQKIIVVEEEDDDDGYEVDNVVDSYEPGKIVDITPVPVTSTLEPQVYVRKRVKVTKKNSTFVDDDREIVKAVRTGLKLVKQAAKEGTQEALAKQFDRYGPGGLRGKSETLQGTVDCQRAGLFRHPSQCNKFYACRWDCTKNRFTLHVFNCPVHLTFDNSLGACNWPSQGPACVENTLITSD